MWPLGRWPFSGGGTPEPAGDASTAADVIGDASLPAAAPSSSPRATQPPTSTMPAGLSRVPPTQTASSKPPGKASTAAPKPKPKATISPPPLDRASLPKLTVDRPSPLTRLTAQERELETVFFYGEGDDYFSGDPSAKRAPPLTCWGCGKAPNSSLAKCAKCGLSRYCHTSCASTRLAEDVSEHRRSAQGLAGPQEAVRRASAGPQGLTGASGITAFR